MRPARNLPGLALLAALWACGSSPTDTTPVSDATEPEGRIEFVRTTAFDGNVLTVDLSSDGATLKLNTLRDAIATEAFRSLIPNQSGRSWVLRNAAYDSTSLVYAVVSWDNNDPTDYLAAGWWVHVPLDTNDPASVQRAVFIDGPEIDTNDPPTMPVAGKARYAGGAGGVVSYRFGASWGGLAGKQALGEYTAVMTAIADFDDGTITGCLGCVGDITSERRHLVSVYEDILGVDLPDVPAPMEALEVHFASTPLNADGTFESTEATVTHPTRTISESEGFWGGSFSNVDDPDGHPRLVGGFSDAVFTEEDGSEGYLWGIFNVLSGTTVPLPSPLETRP